MDFGPHLVFALIEGSVAAAVLALTAVGLSLVFGVMRVVNVAHGEFFMVGAILAWWVATLVGGHPSLGFVAALLVAPVLAGAVAAAADWLVLKRVDYDPEATIVATIGMLYIIQQVALMTFGPDARPVEPPFNERIALPWFEFGENGLEFYYPWGFSTTSYKLFVIGAAAALLLAL
ncbi:MAG: branched-chain amino acid ABC transporter permease, partial [Pseudomonadota bacterium]